MDLRLELLASARGRPWEPVSERKTMGASEREQDHGSQRERKTMLAYICCHIYHYLYVVIYSLHVNIIHIYITCTYVIYLFHVHIIYIYVTYSLHVHIFIYIYYMYICHHIIIMSDHVS